MTHPLQDVKISFRMCSHLFFKLLTRPINHFWYAAQEFSTSMNMHALFKNKYRYFL